MWGAIIQAIDHAAGRINKGAGAGIEVAKSQSGGAAGSSGTTDTTMFGKAVQTATNNIKDKLASLNNNPKVEKAETEETESNDTVDATENKGGVLSNPIESGDTEGAENGTEKVKGAI
mgnify:FL=1